MWGNDLDNGLDHDLDNGLGEHYTDTHSNYSSSKNAVDGVLVPKHWSKSSGESKQELGIGGETGIVEEIRRDRHFAGKCLNVAIDWAV